MSFSEIWNGNVPAQYSGVNTSAINSIPMGFGLQTDETRNAEFARAEMSADNQLKRDLALQESSNLFNAEQAQLQRDFEERMSSTSYQRAVADMKKAGINPILALSNGGADTPQGASASASGARSSGSNYRGSSGIASNLMQVVAGLITKGKGGSMSQIFNGSGELVKTVISKR